MSSNRMAKKQQVGCASIWGHFPRVLPWVLTEDLAFLLPLLQYDKKLRDFLSTYDRAFIVAADNVGSKQFQDIRRVSCGLLRLHTATAGRAGARDRLRAGAALISPSPAGIARAQRGADGQEHADEAVHPPLL